MDEAAEPRDISPVESMESFCRRVSPALVGSLKLQLGDPISAEDIAQEALARAWERWPAVSTMTNPTGWVYRVAFNLAISRRRRRQAERRAHIRAYQPEEVAGDPTDRVALATAIAALTPRQRAAVVLRYYGHLSVAETADALGCAPGTVKALTSQGVSRLSTVLGVEDIDREEPS